MRRRISSTLRVVLERNRAAVLLQRMMRGYIIREKIAIELHKHHMQRQLREQEEMFGSFRQYLLETLQIKLAYLFRKKRAIRLKKEEWIMK